MSGFEATRAPLSAPASEPLPLRTVPSAGSGVLVVDKPRGLSSHAVVAQARKLLGRRDLGHAGTLDPMATGVLLVLVGQACKLSGYLTLESKRYEAEVTFGAATDTLDADGKVTEELALEPGFLSRERALAALASEAARSLQQPPAVSAIKVQGERAYALSRRGEAPELPSRPVAVEALELIGIEGVRLRCALTVSKGYYVRALARDLGRQLGAPAHLTALRRTQSGRFGLELACPWPWLAQPTELPLLSVTRAATAALPLARLNAEGVSRARQGKALRIVEDFAEFQPAAGAMAWLGPAGELVAIGSGENLRVMRGFNPEASADGDVGAEPAAG